jgi:acetyl-CoA carboxylase carboxyltransferase component
MRRELEVIDDVIDPADSRRRIATLFERAPHDWRSRTAKQRPNIDAW